MSAEQTISTDKTVAQVSNHAHEPVRMDVIEEIAAMAEGTERPALIWGNTDRATVAAEALWIFAKRVGLDGRGDDAYTTVQDLIANLMHLCGQEGITGQDMTLLPWLARLKYTITLSLMKVRCGKRGADNGPAAASAAA